MNMYINSILILLTIVCSVGVLYLGLVVNAFIVVWCDEFVKVREGKKGMEENEKNDNKMDMNSNGNNNRLGLSHEDERVPSASELNRNKRMIKRSLKHM